MRLEAPTSTEQSMTYSPASSGAPPMPPMPHVPAVPPAPPEPPTAPVPPAPSWSVVPSLQPVMGAQSAPTTRTVLTAARRTFVITRDDSRSPHGCHPGLETLTFTSCERADCNNSKESQISVSSWPNDHPKRTDLVDDVGGARGHVHRRLANGPCVRTSAVLLRRVGSLTCRPNSCCRLQVSLPHGSRCLITDSPMLLTVIAQRSKTQPQLKRPPYESCRWTRPRTWNHLQLSALACRLPESAAVDLPQVKRRLWRK